jgi:hypothetical protein
MNWMDRLEECIGWMDWRGGSEGWIGRTERMDWRDGVEGCIGGMDGLKG